MASPFFFDRFSNLIDSPDVMRNHTETDARVLNVNTRYRYDNPDSGINGAILKVVLDRGRYCACRVDGKFFSDRSKGGDSFSGACFGYLYKGFLTEVG